ncbi:MAG TPA: AAA family ATPase [Kutzneria sp.]
MTIEKSTNHDGPDPQNPPTPRGKPQVIAVCGSPGAGKTTVARAIASRLGLLLLTRDEIKNGLGLSSGHEPAFHLAGGPYSQRAEAIMVDLARRLAVAGVSFVVETSVLPQELVDTVRLWVHVVARPEVIDARLHARPDRQLADQFRRGELPAAIFAPPAGVDTVIEIDTSDQDSPDIEELMTRLGPGPRRTR